ncbi:hypothetical protein BpHYR1_017076 [Brachionus plicatilis]|uniref:Uncharacterized protein n=1 Tax=Brachionus plicatilis TaxID=10195 RepID=A0A3M7RQW5_BRAPC|nr:hypothetical protein BpHYR1_017076 [Brachionus plicatilis]
MFTLLLLKISYLVFLLIANLSFAFHQMSIFEQLFINNQVSSLPNNQMNRKKLCLSNPNQTYRKQDLTIALFVE